MALPSEEIHFSTSAPTLDAIYQAICEIEGRDVPAKTQRPWTPPPPSPNAWPPPAPRPVDRDSLDLYGAKIHLDINVSQDGHNVQVWGNATELFHSACLALEKLGGTTVKWTPPTPPVRPRMPVEEWPRYLVVSLLTLLAMMCIGLPLVIFLFGYLLPMELLSRRRDAGGKKGCRGGWPP